VAGLGDRPDPLGESKPVEAARHAHVREHDIDADIGLGEDRDRLIAAARLDDAVAAVAQIVGNREADQHLVFHDEDSGCFGLVIVLARWS
jgi:hypothetical protein